MIEHIFKGFPKIARLNREIRITEKIDGSNAQLYIAEDETFLIGSRTQWITPENDNHGFAKWALENKEELMKLGVGRHFGEWWGNGINRGYGLAKGDKRFSLFNTLKWNKENLPSCCGVVPVLYKGVFNQEEINKCLEDLRLNGSKIVPGYMKPEGIVIYHTHGNFSLKVTLIGDEKPKGIKE